MLRNLRLFLGFCGVLLFLMGIRSLVVCPEAAPDMTQGMTPVQTGICITTMTEAERASADGMRDTQETEQSRSIPDRDVQMNNPVSDRNGLPVRNKSYIRSAWQAFVPERMRG